MRNYHSSQSLLVFFFVFFFLLTTTYILADSISYSLGRDECSCSKLGKETNIQVAQNCHDVAAALLYLGLNTRSDLVQGSTSDGCGVWENISHTVNVVRGKHVEFCSTPRAPACVFTEYLAGAVIGRWV